MPSIIVNHRKEEAEDETPSLRLTPTGQLASTSTFITLIIYQLITPWSEYPSDDSKQHGFM
jgi:hypothetical protein